MPDPQNDGRDAELLEIKRRRLRELEKQAAYKGADVPPHVAMEIAELQAEIATLDSRPRDDSEASDEVLEERPAVVLDQEVNQVLDQPTEALQSTSPPKSPARQPLTATAYAWISLVGLVLGIGLLLFYIYQVPVLQERGVERSVFYLLLFPWGLAAAAFLFGAMRSYATYRSQNLPHLVELGGPVVLFALVLVSGFRLVPTTDTFTLTVRVYRPDGTLATVGEIGIDLDTRREFRPLDENGEATFKGIPVRLRGTAFQVYPERIPDGDPEPRTVESSGDVLELRLEPEPVTQVVLRGTLLPPRGADPPVEVIVDGGLGRGQADALGQFEFPVRGKAGQRIRLKVYRGGKLLYDNYEILPGPLNLTLPEAE